MISPILSVVIPCYNQGIFIKDALESLDKCNNNLFEIIIVNDGSSDKFTNDYLTELSENGYHVVFQPNMGLGAARNKGIKEAKGEFVLPLDSDNKIRGGYIEKGIEILSANKDIAVVYANAGYFGDKAGELKPGKFNLQKLMLGNYIDACAVIRKSVIDEVGYYDNMKIMGYEDWDLWLRIAFAGHKFYYIDEVLFDYRVGKGSMMKNLNANIQKQNEIEEYFTNKYPDKLAFEFVNDHFFYKFKKRPLRFIYKQLLKKFFPARYNRLIREHKIYRGFLYDE